MPFRWCVLLASGVIQAGAIAGALDAAPQSAVNAGFGAAIEPDDRTHVLQHYGRLPLSFEVNHGQTDGRVRFYSRGSGYSLFLTDRAAVLSLRTPAAHTGAATPGHGRDEIRMELSNANRKPQLSAADQLPGHANYFIGQDPAQWRSNVPTYGQVRYTGVYPGIDLLFYGNQGQLEYDFIVAPGADPNAIDLKFEGARQLQLTADGDLTIATAHGRIAFRAPVVYQQDRGQRRRIAGRFVVRRGGVGFSVGRYDRSRSLIIDPVLVYSTYLGGRNLDSADAIAIDAEGNAFLVGNTDSANFPVTPGAFDTKYKNPDESPYVNFVAKLNPSGTALLYSTYLGTGACDNVPSFDNGLPEQPQNGLAVDAQGNAYIAGSVCSGHFPVTKGAFQTTIPAGGSPAYVAKLDPTGSRLVYATYLGGSGGISGGDSAAALAVDSSGNAFITGLTNSADFPVTDGAFQTQNRAAGNGGSNAFVTELNADGSGLVYSTYLGGSSLAGFPGDLANAIALDRHGAAYVAGLTYSDDFPVTKGAFQTRNRAHTKQRVGYNAFVTKLDATGSALAYSTYLGGSGAEVGDAANALAVDDSGHAYVAGSAGSPDFPVTKDAFQTRNKAAGQNEYPGNNGFVSKLSPSGDALVYSTFLGGSGRPSSDGAGGDAVYAIGLDCRGDAYVAGITTSGDFPLTRGAFQTINRTFERDVNGFLVTGTSGFVTELNSSGTTLVYSTYLSGTYEDYAKALAVGGPGIVFVAGQTASADFPVSEEALRRTNRGTVDAFIAKLDLTAATTATVTTLESSANPQRAGKPVTFTATVARAAAGSDADAAPGGSVEFLVNDEFGAQITAKVPLDAAGRASYTTDKLAAGSNPVAASYAVVDGDFGPSSSPTLTEIIESSP